MSFSKNQRIYWVVVGGLAVMAALYFIFLSGGSEPGQLLERPNVLVITLDTTRADHLGAYGYKQAKTPHLDSLTQRGVYFKNAISSVPLTLPSHCTIMTGREVLSHQVRNNGTYFLPPAETTLAEIFKEDGYTTAAFVSSFTLDSRFGLSQGFALYNDNLVLNNTQVKTFDSERRAELVYNDFSEWFIKNHETRFFAWVHFYDPHLPYSPPEPFAGQFSGNPYDGEIAYMDLYVGKVIDLLRQQGVLQKTLVVVAGDHGEAFGEHLELGHGIFCYQETLRVPLIMAGENLKFSGRGIEQMVHLSDIVPTVLDYVGLKKPGTLQGRSLLPLINKEPFDPRIFYFESVMAEEALGCAPSRGIIKERYKLIQLPKPELYDLDADTKEADNIFYKQHEVARDLQQELEAWTRQFKTDQVASKRQLSNEELKKLRSLGYLSSSGGKKDSSKLPDPKDKIDGWNEFVRGNIAFNEGKMEEAAAFFKRSLELNRDFSEPYALLAFINYRQGRLPAAKSYYEKGLAVNPDDYLLHIEYIKFLIARNQLGPALKKLRELELLKLVAFEVEIYQLSGVVSMKSNRNPEAIYYFRKALEIEPDNFAISMALARCLNRMQRYQEALAVFLPLAERRPKDFELLLGIAMTQGELEQYQQSFLYFKKALAVESLPAAKFYYAIFLSRAGKMAEAVAIMKEFVAAHKQEDAMRRDALQCLQVWREQIR